MVRPHGIADQRPTNAACGRGHAVLLVAVSFLAGRILDHLLPMAVCAARQQPLAQRSLYRHVADVADALETGGLRPAVRRCR